MKKISQAYLERAAFHYLGRYASSVANLETILIRKVRRRNPENTLPSDEQKIWLQEVVQKCVRLGLVDDQSYCRMKVASMHRSGKARHFIAQTLRHKGVAQDIIDHALETLNEEEGGRADHTAAIAFARKRRFGPYRRNEGDVDRLRKELASFARAGHPYALAKQIIEASSLQELNEIGSS